MGDTLFLHARMKEDMDYRKPARKPRHLRAGMNG